MIPILSRFQPYVQLVNHVPHFFSDESLEDVYRQSGHEERSADIIDRVYRKRTIKRIGFDWIERLDVIVDGGIEKNVQPDAHNSGDSHLCQGGRIGQTEETHYLSDEVAQRIRSHCPREPNQAADEQGMTVTVERIVKIERHDEQRLKIYDDVCPYENGNIQVAMQWQGHRCMWAKVKGSEWHS